MATLICDVDVSRELIARRRIIGSDRFDEVWDGTYVMNPLPNNEHQEIQARIVYILEDVIGLRGFARIYPGVNVSDRRVGWKRNYRCPDVVVFLNNTKAVNCDTFWFGGPDLAVEIATRGDRARDKLAFYAKVGTRELLLIDRKPWSLELFRHDGETLARVGKATIDSAQWLTSAVVPLRWRLVAGKTRPQIEVAHRTNRKKWRI